MGAHFAPSRASRKHCRRFLTHTHTLTGGAALFFSWSFLRLFSGFSFPFLFLFFSFSFPFLLLFFSFSSAFQEKKSEEKTKKRREKTKKRREKTRKDEKRQEIGGVG